MRANLLPGRDVPAAMLWDFDGTLVDVESSWYAAERRMMAELGKTFTEEQSRALMGMSLVDAAGVLLRWAGREDLDPVAYASTLNDYSLQHQAENGIPPRPGALELLEAAREAGVRSALVSMSYTSILERFVETLPAGSFTTVVGGDQVQRGKPDPEPYLVAVAKLGLQVRDCVAVEDSIPGTTSAMRAGLVTLAVPFLHDLEPAPRRRLVPSLSGLSLAGVGAIWLELRDA